jgi:hypothetical protein
MLSEALTVGYSCHSSFGSLLFQSDLSQLQFAKEIRTRPAVNSSRFLVAVDLQDESGQSNGQVDHLFLFALPISFKDSVASRYWGLGSKGRIEWLENLEPASKCDHYGGLVGSQMGWRIGFPLWAVQQSLH